SYLYVKRTMPQPNAVKCLVVDDEPRLRRVLVRLLEGEGFSCAEAGSGTEALEILQQDPVPLVISDLRMPQIDWATLLREIIARWCTSWKRRTHTPAATRCASPTTRRGWGARWGCRRP